MFLFVDEKTKLKFAGKECDKKYIRKKLANGETFGKSQIAKEIAVMKKLQHKNIVKLSEVINDKNDNNIYLVMEYLQKGAILSSHHINWELKNKT